MNKLFVLQNEHNNVKNINQITRLPITKFLNETFVDFRL